MKIKTKGLFEVNLSDLKDFQGEIKYLSAENLQKLCLSLQKNGFCEPFIVWRKAGEKTFNILNGHQRKKAIEKLAESGEKIPDKFPAVEIRAKSFSEAKKIVLSLAGTYGRIDRDLLEGYAAENDLDIKDCMDWISFPDFSIPKSFLTEGDGGAETKDRIGGQTGDDIEIVKIPVLAKSFGEAMGLFDKAYNLIKRDGRAEDYGSAFIEILRDWIQDFENQKAENSRSSSS